MQRFEKIRTIDDLEAQTLRFGVLPYFSNRIPGWSVEENIIPEIWFTDREGPWEWKGRLASEKRCVYGKLLQGKAAFVSLEWFAELANWRRDAMTFDERVDAGLGPHKDRLLMRYVSEHPGELSKYARRECGFEKGFDTVLTRLQMQTYGVNQDFRYSLDRHGHPYGWGIAALCAAEDWLGEALLEPPEGREPEESLERLVNHLHTLMPDVDVDALRREIE